MSRKITPYNSENDFSATNQDVLSPRDIRRPLRVAMRAEGIDVLAYEEMRQGGLVLLPDYFAEHSDTLMRIALAGGRQTKT